MNLNDITQWLKNVGNLRRLKSKDEWNRKKGLVGLGRYKNTTAIKAILPLLSDQSKFVRLGALRALDKIGDRSVTDDLVPLLRDEWDVVAATSAEILYRLGWEPQNASEAVSAAIAQVKHSPSRMLRDVHPK